MVMTNSVGQFGFGESTPITTTTRRKERFVSKGRSTRTYQNKLKRVKKLYKRLYKASIKAKQPRKDAFHIRYPNEASFLKTIKIKEANIRK